MTKSNPPKFFTLPLLLAGLLTPRLANAKNYVLDLGTCQNDLGGVWSIGTKSCTLSNVTLRAASVLTVPASTLLIFDGACVNKGEIAVEAGGVLSVGVGDTLKNKGAIAVDGEGFNYGEIDNVDDGVLVNAGRFTNEGAILGHDLGALTNSGGIFDNYGEITTFDVGASILNLAAGTLHNRGGSISVEAGLLSNEDASTITNQDGATISISWSGYFDNVLDALVLNRVQGTIENTGTSTNSTGALLDNYGKVLNYGTLYNSGDAEIINRCQALFVNIELFENWDSALLVNDGDFDNVDTLKNFCGATLENHDTWEGGLDNYGGKIVNTGTFLAGSPSVHNCIHKG